MRRVNLAGPVIICLFCLILLLSVVSSCKGLARLNGYIQISEKRQSAALAILAKRSAKPKLPFASGEKDLIKALLCKNEFKVFDAFKYDISAASKGDFQRFFVNVKAEGTLYLFASFIDEIKDNPYFISFEQIDILASPLGGGRIKGIIRFSYVLPYYFS